MAELGNIITFLLSMLQCSF